MQASIQNLSLSLVLISRSSSPLARRNRSDIGTFGRTLNGCEYGAPLGFGGNLACSGKGRSGLLWLTESCPNSRGLLAEASSIFEAFPTSCALEEIRSLNIYSDNDIPQVVDVPFSGLQCGL